MSTKSVIALPQNLAAESEVAKPVVEAATPVYFFTLDSFRIAKTRALLNDTDYVCTALIVAQNPPVVSPVRYMGNVGDGTHDVNLSIPSVAVGPADHAAFTYLIVNCGHGSRDNIENALQKAVSAAALKLAQQWTTTTATAAPAGTSGPAAGAPSGTPKRTAGPSALGWLVGEVEGILFADCDGTVAAGNCVFFLGEMASETAIANGKPVSYTDFSPGTNSADGCGANSQYYVTWSFSTQPPTPAGGPGPGPGGGDSRPSDDRAPLRLE